VSPTTAAVPTGSWRFDDAAVEFAIRKLTEMGLVEQVAEWRAQERERLGRHAGGAPTRVPDEAILVAMLLAAIHERPLLATTVCHILFRHISPTMRARLGVEDPPADGDLRGWEALHRCVLNRIHAHLEPMDPSPLPKNRRLAPAAFDAAVKARIAEHQLTDEVLADRVDRLTWAANSIIQAAHSELPSRVWGQWQGSVALDATPIPAFARSDRRAQGKGPRSKRTVVTHSADEDAGLYIRTDRDDADPKADKSVRKMRWAYEATLVIAGNDDPSHDHAIPPIVMGMAPLHRPATNVGQNAITALTQVAERGYPAGWLAGDRAYTHAQPDEFHLPARSLGYQPVLDYRDDQLGIKDSHAGAVMIEGAWYCPMIPESLANATLDFRAKRIDETTYATRIEARRAYRMRGKGRPDDEGHVKLLCPAAHLAPTARCDLKKRSETRTPTTATRIHVTDALRANKPKICAQESVTFPPDAGGTFGRKLVQELHFGSPEWAATYHTLRNANEGIHGLSKDGAHESLDDPSRRRIRGIAFQTIAVAMQLFAYNLRAITSFLTHAVIDTAGVLRRARARTDTTGAPRRPGTRPRRRNTKPIQDWQPRVTGRSGAPPP